MSLAESLDRIDAMLPPDPAPGSKDEMIRALTLSCRELMATLDAARPTDDAALRAEAFALLVEYHGKSACRESSQSWERAAAALAALAAHDTPELQPGADPYRAVYDTPEDDPELAAHAAGWSPDRHGGSEL